MMSDDLISFIIIMKLLSRCVYNYLRMDKQQLNIVLSPNEQQVFTTLALYRQELQLKTVMRVAGGWVRDKIMGKESHDIDIALDDMKGEEFVLLLKKHAESKNEKISSFGVTKLNPDLSKHLETATAKIHNIAIDFVNLREETYNEVSRIPTIQVGTPLTDALRRDFTINSLFYNLNTGEVEDYTERGVSDIFNRVIRTPLEPLVTFKDDPLRVLRCFRFKSRFDFAIHEDIYNSLGNDGVHQALRTKVSRERVGIQLAGILKAQYPMKAFEQILKYNYWNIIFEIPKESDLKDQEFIHWIPSYSYFMIQEGRKSIEKNGLVSHKDLVVGEGEEVKDKRPRYTEEELKIVINLVFLTLVYRTYKVEQGKKTLNLIDHIVRNELKYSAKISKFAHRAGELITDLEKILSESTEETLKVRIIKWLRSAEQKWEIVIHALHAMSLADNFKKLMMAPLDLRSYILQESLADSYLVEPFIDGSFLIKRGKKGPIIKTILDNAIIWRILNRTSDKQSFLQLFEQNSVFFENDQAYN